MTSDADEVRKAIGELKASGEYGRFASREADAQADYIGRALARATELSDEAVEDLAATLEMSKDYGDGSPRAEVERTVARYRRSTQSARSRPTAPDPTVDVTNFEYQPDKSK